MSKIKLTAQIITYTLISALIASAQQAQTPQVSTVNVTPERGRVRVAPVGEISDMRIEVVNESGDTIFESPQRAREQIDWDMKDSAGVRVAPGTYTVTVSYTTQSGKQRKRIEQVLLTDERTVSGSAAETTAAAISNAPNPQPLVDGTGAANRLPKFTDTDTLTSSSIMDVGGNISIGKLAAPVAGLRLEINGYTRMNTAGSGGYMQFGTPNGETGFSWIKGTASRADIRFNGTALTIAAGTGINVPPNTYGIVIRTSGRVGIGTPNPLAKLYVVGGSDPAVYGYSHDSIGLWGEGDYAGVFGSGRDYGVHGVSAYTTGKAVYGRNTGGWAGYFDGKVQVNGALTATGNICAANIPCSSDARLKQNVTSLGYGLNQLLRLRPVSWRWKSEPEGKPQMGLVAQEVEKVLPELVLKDADATKPLGLNYMALLPVAVKAIQEQQAQIQQQQKRIEQLQARVTQLERAGKMRRQKRP